MAKREPPLAMQFDAELMAIRLVLEQLLAERMLREPEPYKTMGKLFEDISRQLDKLEANSRTPYGAQLWPLAREKLTGVLGRVTKLLAPNPEAPEEPDP